MFAKLWYKSGQIALQPTSRKNQWCQRCTGCLFYNLDLVVLQTLVGKWNIQQYFEKQWCITCNGDLSTVALFQTFMWHIF